MYRYSWNAELLLFTLLSGLAFVRRPSTPPECPEIVNIRAPESLYYPCNAFTGFDSHVFQLHFLARGQGEFLDLLMCELCRSRDGTQARS